MQHGAILIDFGSTFTKVTAVDLERSRVLARAEAPTTVARGLQEGLAAALTRLAAGYRPFAAGRSGLDMLADRYVRASSSAAGGLRIGVVGNVPGLTVEAGNAAALGAGAKVVGTFGFKLDHDDITRLVALRCDLILLTGGTEGGDTATLVHNARLLAASAHASPVIVAGNSAARAEACNTLARAGKTVSFADNVMPEAGHVAPGSAREEIRRCFIARITAAEAFAALPRLVSPVKATPDAVLRGAALAAQGTGDIPGWGDLMLVDIGGATTDVHSIGEGAQPGADIVPQGLPEPYEKRTVEGDLGIRVNARTILEQVGAARLAATFAGLFPRLDMSGDALADYVRAISADTGRTPRLDWEWAVDVTLGRVAADIAIERHVGRREPYYARDGVVWLQSGKNLTEAKVLIGTGGIFAHNRLAGRILEGHEAGSGQPRVLRPVAPLLLVDSDYLMHVAGLLAEDHPRAGLLLLEDHLMAGTALRPRPAAAPAAGRHGHNDHDCCD